MRRVAKGLLIAQAIVCILLVPLLSNMPLQVSRMEYEARNVASSSRQEGAIEVATQATVVADFLHEWGIVLITAMAVLSVAGTLIGLVGWLALNQKENSTASKAT